MLKNVELEVVKIIKLLEFLERVTLKNINLKY